VEGVAVDLHLPAGAKAASVVVSSPEAPDEVPIPFASEGGRVRFAAPGSLVYGVVRVRLTVE
jgi:hypothetical protein